MQIRFLTDTILNLYRTYKKEGGKASYSTLVRYRPFYVLSSKLHNRETCACLRHANIGFKITKLYILGILKTNKIEDILKDIACNLSCKECMYGNYHVCVMKKVEIKKNPDDKTVCWLQWCMKIVPYKKSYEEGEVVETFSKRFSKEVISDQFGSLLQKFHQEVTLFKKHYFNMMHQHKLFRECVDNIKKNEIVIVVDFSENYHCKYNLEIQITLHTGVAYVKNEDAAGFCSISPNNEHTPHSIWAHLLSVLNSIKYQHPEIYTLHVHSDGSTTQYRQKKNFALFDVITKQLGYKYATWSYFEAAHGKNAADGIDGVLKRTLDRHVAYGKDVSNAVEAFMLLKEETNISLYYVSDKDIKVIKETYAVFDLYPLIGTMSLHQIITTNKPGVIKYRHIIAGVIIISATLKIITNIFILTDDNFIAYSLVTSAPTIMCSFVLFVLPVKFDCLKFCTRDIDIPTSISRAFLTWSLIKNNILWSVLFVTASTNITFEAMKHTKMLEDFKKFLVLFMNLPHPVLALTVIILCKVLTEFGSSSSVVDSMLKQIAYFSVEAKMNPLYLMITTTLSSCQPFHLITGASTYALVAAYVNIPHRKMIIAGIGPSLAGILISLFTISVWSKAVWSDIDIYPKWAETINGGSN